MIQIGDGARLSRSGRGCGPQTHAAHGHLKGSLATTLYGASQFHTDAHFGRRGSVILAAQAHRPPARRFLLANFRSSKSGEPVLPVPLV
jgi:hypothetical protein